MTNLSSYAEVELEIASKPQFQGLRAGQVAVGKRELETVLLEIH